jgi:hypothetical protein
MEQITVMAGQVGLFLGETAKYLGEHCWIWLLGAVLTLLVYYGCYLLNEILSCDSPEGADASDPEPLVPERDLIESARAAVWFWKCVFFGFCAALILGAGNLFMNFICRGGM